MHSHRTTIRAILLTLLAGLLAATAAAAPTPSPARRPASVPMIFPVVGPVQYRDDFGEPRGQGRHEGNDILTAKRSPAVAAEDGRIKFWTTSARAGCMLYLYGASGTTYLYIHLNNDLTKGNDNRGRCIAGTSYWPGLKDSAIVKAGQPIALVGDSGDADGTPHLHFEVHPHDGAATDPYSYLQTAQHLVFVADPRSTVTLSMTGAFLSSAAGQLKLQVETLLVLPAKTSLTKLGRSFVVTVPPNALVQRLLPSGIAGGSVTLSQARRGQAVSVLTQPVAASLDVELGRDGVLSAAQVLLR